MGIVKGKLRRGLSLPTSRLAGHRGFLPSISPIQIRSLQIRNPDFEFRISDFSARPAVSSQKVMGHVQPPGEGELLRSFMVSKGMAQLETDPLSESGVGQTSLLIAAWRAREAEQIDPLFVDPIANIFVTPAMETWVDKMTQASVSTRHLISYRTRYLDDYLVSEMERGVAQIVLLGAGLDTRSLRLGHPSATFYEIDRSEVLSYKQQQLERYGYAAGSHFIEGDYIRDDLFALLGSRGFKADKETFFIWEGNTMYIPADVILGFLSRLRAGVSRFRISFDYVSEEMIQRKTGFAGAGNLVSGFENIGAPWMTGFADIHRVAEQTGLAIIENKWMVDVLAPSRFRVTLGRDLFRHYSVCTLSSHE